MTLAEWATTLRGMQPVVTRAVVKSCEKTALYGEGRIRRRLSGPVLKRRSGSLRNTTRSKVNVEGKDVRLIFMVGSADVPYGPPHEYGPTAIRAKVAGKPMRFKIDGQWISKYAIVIPGRPFVAPSAAESQKFIEKVTPKILAQEVGAALTKQGAA